jgi:GGDEF domain-containing protein
VALHDLLTGLPNRTLLCDRLGQELARAPREWPVPGGN